MHERDVYTHPRPHPGPTAITAITIPAAASRAVVISIAIIAAPTRSGRPDHELRFQLKLVLVVVTRFRDEVFRLCASRVGDQTQQANNERHHGGPEQRTTAERVFALKGIIHRICLLQFPGKRELSRVARRNVESPLVRCLEMFITVQHNQCEAILCISSVLPDAGVI